LLASNLKFSFCSGNANTKDISPFLTLSGLHKSSRKLAFDRSCDEFLRRFLQHVLPKGFPRIRYFGWLANRTRKHLLSLCRLLLHQPLPASGRSFPNRANWQCPLCHGPMYLIERLSATQVLLLETRLAFAYDTS
jgi:putative transposase